MLPTFQCLDCAIMALRWPVLATGRQARTLGLPVGLAGSSLYLESYRWFRNGYRLGQGCSFSLPSWQFAVIMTVLLPKLAAMDEIDFDFNEEDNLSSALDTETLTARDMIPEGFDNTPRARASTEQLIRGRKYLVINQTANMRQNSKVSKIWQHGKELRALNTPNLDKYWLYNLCLPAKQLYKVSSNRGNNTTAPA